MAADKSIPGVSSDGDVEWPLTFPLRRSIAALGDDHSALTLQEPTGKEAVKYSLLTRGLADDTIAPLLSDLSSIPEASIIKMAAADLIKLTKILGDFFAQAAR